MNWEHSFPESLSVRSITCMCNVIYTYTYVFFAHIHVHGLQCVSHDASSGTEGEPWQRLLLH